MTALQGWIVIGLLVLIMLAIVGIGAEIEGLPWLWRTYITMLVIWAGSATHHPQRRFPPPWTVEDIGACFVVIDSAGQGSIIPKDQMRPARTHDNCAIV